MNRASPPYHISRKRAESLDYLRSMLGQLRRMAEAERADMLAYLIEMAYLEASDILRGERPVRLGERSHPANQKRDAAAGMAFEPSGEVELQQDHEDLGGVEAGMADDLVDADGRRAEAFDDAGAVAVGGRRRA